MCNLDPRKYINGCPVEEVERPEDTKRQELIGVVRGYFCVLGDETFLQEFPKNQRS